MLHLIIVTFNLIYYLYNLYISINQITKFFFVMVDMVIWPSLYKRSGLSVWFSSARVSVIQELFSTVLIFFLE